jgi:hypothetical protein
MTTLNNIKSNKRFLIPALIGAGLLVMVPMFLGALVLAFVLFGGSDDYDMNDMGQYQGNGWQQGFGGQDFGMQDYGQQDLSQQWNDNSTSWLDVLGDMQGGGQQTTDDNYWTNGNVAGNHNADNSAGYVYIPNPSGGVGMTSSYGF